MGSVRSSLTVGVAATVLAAGAGAAVVMPAVAAPLPMMATPAVQLSALVASLPRPAAAKPTKPITGPFAGGITGSISDWIINSYNAVQPWVQYSVDLGAWGVGFMPFPISVAAPQMTIAYSGIEPLAQASVYSFAYAVGGKWNLIGPTVKNGVDVAYGNFVGGQIGWITSFFPPAPPLRGAAVTAPKAAAAVATAASAPGVRPAAPATVLAPQGKSPGEQPGESLGEPVAVTAEPAAVDAPPTLRAAAAPRRAAARAPQTVPSPPAAAVAAVDIAVDSPANTAAAADSPASADVADRPVPAPIRRASSVGVPSPQEPSSRGHRGTRDSSKGSPRAAGSTKSTRSGR